MLITAHPLPLGKIPVCVFAKSPKTDRVKTRLASVIGDHAARKLAQAFFEDTWNMVSQLAWAVPVLVTTGSPEDFGLSADNTYYDQRPGNLGERMSALVEYFLIRQTCRSVIFMGSDSPGLPADFLEQAGQHLDTYDTVIGPTEDGGFYLLGLTKFTDEIFKNIPWSTDKTFDVTLKRLTSLTLTTHTLPSWFDIDRPSDLEKLKERLSQKTLFAPKTEYSLCNLGIL